MQDLSRLELITSKEKIEKIKEKNILLIGLGGVGGYTFETLVRSGIENITVVDGDTFEESNLNRQVLSLKTTLNQNKTDIAELRAKEINPNIKIKKITKELTKDNIKEGDSVEGIITRIKNFGAFVEVYDGVEALLPINEVTEYQNKNSLILNEGDKITTTILKFNPEDRRISLSLKPKKSEEEQ